MPRRTLEHWHAGQDVHRNAYDISRREQHVRDHAYNLGRLVVYFIE